MRVSDTESNNPENVTVLLSVPDPDQYPDPGRILRVEG
jgi:hypothetical protein